MSERYRSIVLGEEIIDVEGDKLRQGERDMQTDKQNDRQADSQARQQSITLSKGE